MTGPGRLEPSRPIGGLPTWCGRYFVSASTNLQLLLRQQQLPGRLNATFETARDHSEDARELKLHRYRGVKHIDDARNGLSHTRDAESQQITVPSFPTSTRATRQLPNDPRKAGFDGPSSLGAAELVWDAD